MNIESINKVLNNQPIQGQINTNTILIQASDSYSNGPTKYEIQSYRLQRR